MKLFTSEKKPVVYLYKQKTTGSDPMVDIQPLYSNTCSTSEHAQVHRIDLSQATYISKSELVIHNGKKSRSVRGLRS